ncbi:MAG TPA: YtxH domain-containing protein [Spirosoma sp.]|jgi:gas vesicle protein|nr:YtxH domain-containing protein [Spirosoma sp.]
MKSLPGIIVGLAIGAAVGLLLAPQSGKKTRRRISSESDSFFKDLQDQLQTGLENIKNQYNNYVDTASAKTEDAVKQVKRKVNH